MWPLFDRSLNLSENEKIVKAIYDDTPLRKYEKKYYFMNVFRCNGTHLRV